MNMTIATRAGLVLVVLSALVIAAALSVSAALDVVEHRRTMEFYDMTTSGFASDGSAPVPRICVDVCVTVVVDSERISPTPVMESAVCSQNPAD